MPILISFVRALPRRSVARAFSTSHVSRSAKTNNPRLAVLYQAMDPPVVNGVRNPKKLGGLLPPRI